MTVEEFKNKYLDVINERRNEFIIACDTNDYDSAFAALVTSMAAETDVSTDIKSLPPVNFVITHRNSSCGWCFVYNNYECACYRIGESDSYCIQVKGKNDCAICDEVFNNYSYLGKGTILSGYERTVVKDLIQRRSMEPYDQRKYDVE